MAALLAARRWGWALATSAILAAGCAIPDRGNPYDPVNAPPPLLPVVRVVDLGDSCSPAVAATAGQISLVSRGRCVALDASQSSDPEGNGIEFAFLWEGGDGGNGVDLYAPDPGFPAVAVLSSSLRAEMPADTVLHFAMRVTSLADGRTAHDYAQAVFTNAEPEARISPPVVLPPGGFAWDPDDEFTITVSGADSGDADGDPLRYCYSVQRPGAAVEENACSSDPLLPVTVPSVPGRTVVRLAVEDGTPAQIATKRSRTALTTIEVGAAGPWVRPVDAAGPTAGPWSRLDSLQVRFDPGFTTAVGAFLPAVAGNQPARVISAEGPRVVTRDLPDLEEVSAITPSSPIFYTGLGFDSVRLWGLAALSSNQPLSFQVFSVNAAGSVSAELRSATFPFDDFDADLAALAGDGALWFPAWPVGVAGTSARITFAGSTNGFAPGTITPLVPAGERIVGFTPRPGSDEMWVATYRDDTGENRLRSFGSAGIPGAVDRAVSGEEVRGLAFATESLLWWLEDGLLRLTEETAESSTELLQIPLVASFRSIRVDPRTGDAWLTGSAGITVRAGLDGDLEEWLGDSQIEGIDDDGALWVRDLQGIHHRTRAPGPGGATVTVTLGDGEAHLNPSDGGFWIRDFGLRRLAADGGELRHITRILPQGSNQPVPIPDSARILPAADGLDVWLVEDGAPGALSILDLANDVPQQTVVPLAPTGLFGAARMAPVAGGSRGLWLLTDDGVFQEMKLASVFPDGTRADEVLFAAGETPGTVDEGYYALPAIAASPVSEAACVASADLTNTLRVRRAEPGGGASLLGTIELAMAGTSGTFSGAVAATVDPDFGEVCWVLWFDAPCSGGSTHAVAFSEAGRVRDLTLPVILDAGVAINPFGPHVTDGLDLWIPMGRCLSSASAGWVRVSANATSGTPPVERFDLFGAAAVPP